MLQKSKYQYADLHFHTNYSDNRDNATVEQMLKRGAQMGISCFGTGDHNHNLTEDTWRAQATETNTLRRQYPDFELFNNCELTFRSGHALLLSPEVIIGSIEEAYRYLYQPSGNMLIINHPYLAKDRWKGSIIPHVGGVEVINGADYSHGSRGEVAAFREQMLSFYEYTHIIDFPHVTCYADYLAQGVPVLPFGNSDAHSLVEIGTGVTGFWYNRLGEAIEKSALFAATDTGIRLYWEYDQHSSLIIWNAEIDPSRLIHDRERYPPKVESYRGDTLLSSHSTLSGKIHTREEGYYWFGLQQGSRFAVSSPVRVGNPKKTTGIYRFPMDLQRELYLDRESFTDIPPGNPRGDEKVDYFEVYLYASESVQVMDSAGHPMDRGQKVYDSDVVINKTGDPRQVEEFFVWFERNEVHEYKFAGLDYSIDKSGVLRLQALLLPALYLPEGCNDEQTRHAGADIRSCLDRIESVELYVEIPPLRRAVFKLPGEEDRIEYPLLVIDRKLGLQSRIRFSQSGKKGYQCITRIGWMTT